MKYYKGYYTDGIEYYRKVADTSRYEYFSPRRQVWVESPYDWGVIHKGIKVVKVTMIEAVVAGIIL